MRIIRHILIIIFFGALSVRAQELHTSPQYPLEARIINVEMRTGSAGTSGVYTDPTTGAVSGGGGGGTYTWHLMKAVIGDRLYGLSVPLGVSLYGIQVQHRSWLEVGTYPAKRVKNGFDFQYLDDAGKVRHEVLRIESEEPAHYEQSLAPSNSATQESEQIASAKTEKHSYHSIKTGNDLLALCSTPEPPVGSEFDFALCAGYFRGVQDTIGDLAASGVKTSITLCFDEKSDREARSDAVMFMRDNPAMGNEDAAAVAMVALSHVFRCAKAPTRP